MKSCGRSLSPSTRSPTGWKRRLRDFGYGSKDCEVVNYWSDDPPVQRERRERRSGCCVVRKKDNSLFLVLQTWNKTATDVAVKIDIGRLGFVPAGGVWDVDASVKLPVASTADFRISLAGPYGTRILRSHTDIAPRFAVSEQPLIAFSPKPTFARATPARRSCPSFHPLELGKDDLGDVRSRLGHEMNRAHVGPVAHRLLAEAVDQLVRRDDHFLPMVGGGDLDLDVVIIVGAEDQGLRLGAVELERQLCVGRGLPFRVIQLLRAGTGAVVDRAKTLDASRSFDVRHIRPGVHPLPAGRDGIGFGFGRLGGRVSRGWRR